MDSVNRPTRPGLFITATDTEVGKTVVTAAIARVLRRAGAAPALLKPFATGCHRAAGVTRVSPDAQILQRLGGSTQALAEIAPIRFEAPRAPAPAAEEADEGVPWEQLGSALRAAEAHGDTLVVEGIGGLLVPLDPTAPGCTVLDLVRAWDLPLVVVTRPDLGTLNHTALTVRAAHDAGCRVAGLVVNRAPPDSDAIWASNRRWLKRLTGASIVAELPEVQEELDSAEALPDPLRRAAEAAGWGGLCAPPR